MHCDTSGVDEFVNEPTDEAPCGLLYETSTEVSHSTRWYQDGLIIRRAVQVHVDGTWSLSPTGEGPTVAFGRDMSWDERFAIPGDIDSGVLSQRGSTLRVPRVGSGLHDSGQWLPDGIARRPRGLYGRGSGPPLRPASSLKLTGAGRTAMKVRAFSIGLYLSIVVVAGCASSGPVGSEVPSAGIVSPTPARSQAPPADLASPSASTASIVGEWHATITCEKAVASLEDAGFGSSVVPFLVDGGFVPGATDVTAIKDPAKPCKGAVPRDHAHFFRSNGVFGSLDWQGNQVDDGHTRSSATTRCGSATVRRRPDAQNVTFRFQISGDDLTLAPVIPADCGQDPCLGDARWAATVAMGGTRWHRIP